MPVPSARAQALKALSMIYAAEAAQHGEVIRFSERALTDSEQVAQWVINERKGPFPQYRLLDLDQVGQWVQDRLAEETGDAHADVITYVHAIRLDKGTERLARLSYVADARERRQTVHVYAGSAEIRYHDQSTTTRVTMTLDPALAPEQVMSIYIRLRNRLRADGVPRTLSPKSYYLAGYVGPHVGSYVARPADKTVPGRRPAPGPHGYARITVPLPGHTWQTLCAEWNMKCAKGELESGWRYDAVRNFTRDAQSAFAGLLFQGWQPPRQDEDAAARTAATLGNSPYPKLSEP